MWAELKEFHKGETCLVIGNGPSLKNVPLAFLQKHPSFGSNRIYKLDEFTPTYYVAVNPKIIDQWSDEIEAITATKFIRAEMQDRITDSLPLHSAAFPMFSRNPSVCVYEGFTVTYVSMQLAWWMGFSTVLLVGVDHRYEYEGKPNQLKTVKGADPNHFTDDYFPDGCQWHNPDLARSEQAYRMAKTVFSRAGRRIINLTEGTALDVFEKGKVADYA